MHLAALSPPVPCFQSAIGIKQRIRRSRFICRDSSGQQPSPINEDLIARLKAAEEEAQRLKKELAAAKSQDTSASDTEEVEEQRAAAGRIDGGDMRRETLAFVESKSRNWLSESDVDFFTGGGPSEAASSAGGDGDVDAGVVTRRLLIGIGLSVGVGAFALIPTEKLQPAPSKPLFFYLVPLVRVQGLLKEAEDIIPNGDYEALRTVLSRIEGSPNNVQDNLRSAAASLSGSRAAETADYVARDVYEYIKGIDYQTYYDSVGGAMGVRGGSGQKELFDYSQQSAAAARKKLDEFLALMPRDQVEAAQQQASTLPF